MRYVEKRNKTYNLFFLSSWYILMIWILDPFCIQPKYDHSQIKCRVYIQSFTSYLLDMKDQEVTQM
jgi:hypothetical protein